MPLAADTMQNVRINSDNTTQLQNEEMIAINPYNTDQVAAVWRDFRLGYRQVGYGYSTDGGASWADALFASYETFPELTWESDPGLGVDKDGNFIAHTLAIDPIADNSDICVYRSTDGGQSWSTPTIVVGGDFGFEDKQWMAIDKSNSPNSGNIYFSWTRFPDFGNTHILFAKSEDTAQTWVVTDPLSDQTGYVQWSTVTVDDTGKIYVAWDGFGPSATTISMRTSMDGEFFTPEQTVVNLQAGYVWLNGGIGTFSFPAMEADISDSSPYQGNVYIAYMDQTLGDADIFFVKSTNRGTSWSTPIRINDDAVSNGRDQFHPWISVNEDGVITVVFFDRRNDPGNLYFDLYMTQSFDAGNTWTPNLRITNASSYPQTMLATKTSDSFDPFRQPIATSPLAELLGEYIGVSSVDRYVNMIWTDTRRGNQDAFGSRFSGFYPPLLLAPADGIYLNDKTPLLQWQSAGYYDTATTFRLQWSINPQFATVETTITGISANQYQIEDPDSLVDGTYYWRVKGFSSGGDSSLYSRSFSFILDTQAPATPSLIAPLNDTAFRDTTPYFTWTAVVNPGSPLRYSLQIAEDSLFSTGLRTVIDLQTSNYLTPESQPLANDQNYCWRARAYDLAGNMGGYSAVFKFYIKPFWVDGDANGDRKVTLGDVIFLVNYIFNKPGDWTPVPIESGDPNCDNQILLTDVIQLVNYIFNKPGNWNPCLHP
jgi:hypothetical protein